MNKFMNSIHSIYSVNLRTMINRLRGFGIFKRLMISSLIVILIPNIIIGFFSFRRFSSEMDATIASYSYKTLYSLDTSITISFNEYKDLANSLYRNTALSELLKKCAAIKEGNPKNFSTSDYEYYKREIGKILYSKQSTDSGIVNIEIVSDDDQFIQYNYDNKPVGAKIFDLDSFRNAEYYKKSVEAFHTPIWWDTSEEISVYEVYPYSSAYLGGYLTLLKAIPKTGSQGNLGVIVINISLQHLSEMFNENNPYINRGTLASTRSQYLQKGDLVLLSDLGVIQYFIPNLYFVKLNDTMIHEILNLNTDSIIRKIDDKEYLITAIKSDLTGWSLCSIVPRNNLLQSVYEIRNVIIKTGLICVAVAFIMSYIVALSISRPIKSLKSTMGKVDENNIDILYVDDFDDEVGVLGKKFNSMIKRIQNLINTVYEAELNKKEEMLRRKQAELDALQMQINPHFLYNTLDIIRWQVMADENSEHKSSKMISAFSDLLRLGTKRSANLVPIREEVEHVKAYIEVVRFDLEYNLQVSYDISDEINTCKIPKFTFQPLIENVIVHGFSHKQGDGQIVIEGAIENNDIVIKITDNGEGMTSDVLDSINENLDTIDPKSKSIGLRNVNERIKLYFGEQYGLKLKSTQGENTTALILIPLIND